MKHTKGDGYVKIRKMKQGEIQVIRELRVKGYREYETCVSSEHWNVLKTSLLSDNDIKSNADIFVAEIDGNIAGSIVLFPASIQAYDWSEDVQEYPEIRMLSVNPDIRGKGIGRALVEHCLQVAKEQNNAQIGLHTASFMTKASALYESMGFSRVTELDLEPMNDGIIVKAYRLNLKKNA